MITALLLAITTRAAPATGDTLAPFELRTVAEQPFAWKPGRVTVLSFCAFWCDTWKDQLPRVDETRRITDGLPVDYLTISVDGRWTDKAKSVAVGKMLADAGGLWSHAMGIDRVPYTLVVDPRGLITWSGYGTIRSAGLVQEVRRALKAPAGGGTVYLTFDDFPSEHLSEELLDELRAQGVAATFFCIGTHVSSFPTIARRAEREGHRLQIHSWDHNATDPQIEKCNQLLGSFGPKADLYRAPGSERVCDLQGRALSFPIDDPYDFNRPGVSEVQRRVLSQVRAGSVIQLHAGVADTLEALPAIIANLKKRGFRFEVLAAKGDLSSRLLAESLCRDEMERVRSARSIEEAVDTTMHPEPSSPAPSPSGGTNIRTQGEGVLLSRSVRRITRPC